MSEEATAQEVIQKVEIVEKPQPTVQERIKDMLMHEMEAETPSQPKQEAPTETEEVDDGVREERQDDDSASEELSEAEPKEANEEADEEDNVLEQNVSNLNELAEVLGVEVADLYGIKVPITNASGEREEVSIGEWKNEAQAKIQEQQKEAQQAWEAKQEEVRKQEEYLGQQVQQAGMAIQLMEQNLANEIKSIDWQTLRRDDPAEYAALIQDKEAKVRQMEQVKQGLGQQVQQLQEQSLQERSSSYQERLQAESQKLVDAIPEWSNSDRAATEQAELTDYLTKSGGYTSDEAGRIIDHRFVLLARKAAAYDKLKKANPEKKKVVKIGKRTVKPGTRQTRTEQKSGYRDQMKQNLKKSGSVADFAKLLME